MCRKEVKSIVTNEDKEYLHETFISRKECSECTAKIRKELAEGNTAFATIRQDLQYIKEKIDKKSRLNVSVVMSVIQALCTLAVTVIAARLGT